MEYSLSCKESNQLYLNNMEIALNRIVKAINEREKIVIYGYHDFDSICAISLLMLVLRYVNSDVEYFIPNIYRKNRDLIKEDVEDNILCLGANLIITLGCGINSREELKICKDNNIDIIVTDYHGYSIEDTNCISINQYKSNFKYSFREFTACSLTYNFIEVISDYYKISCTKKYLDLVMMGIITTGVNLKYENRGLVEEGYKMLSITNNYGIKALMKEHNKNYGDTLSFYNEGIKTILPKMITKKNPNNARIIVELFTTNDSYRAKQIAKYLYKELMRKKDS